MSYFRMLQILNVLLPVIPQNPQILQSATVTFYPKVILEDYLLDLELLEITSSGFKSTGEELLELKAQRDSRI